jgi:uroporphyrin-III C-methyltransferase
MAPRRNFDWAPLARAGQPIVLYMVMHNLERIAADLMAGGLAPQTPAAIIAGGDAERARAHLDAGTLFADAQAQKFEPPAIVVIGEIVTARATASRRKRGGREKAKERK